MKEELTQEELKRQLNYDPDTGVFTWISGNNRNTKPGDIAGSYFKGYLRIRVNGRQYFAHRLAYLYIEGYFPEYQVDHKNGVRDANRWSNLRHVTNACNMQNQIIRSNNTTGFPGVYKHYNGWRGMIRINDKLIRIGTYNDPLEAALARFTFEVWCPLWKCNYRSELVKSIKAVWPEFRTKKDK